MDRKGKLVHLVYMPSMRIQVAMRDSKRWILLDIMGYAPKLGHKVVFAVIGFRARLSSLLTLLPPRRHEFFFFSEQT